MPAQAAPPVKGAALAEPPPPPIPQLRIKALGQRARGLRGRGGRGGAPHLPVRQLLSDRSPHAQKAAAQQQAQTQARATLKAQQAAKPGAVATGAHEAGVAVGKKTGELFGSGPNRQARAATAAARHPQRQPRPAPAPLVKPKPRAPKGTKGQLLAGIASYQSETTKRRLRQGVPVALEQSETYRPDTEPVPKKGRKRAAEPAPSAAPQERVRVLMERAQGLSPQARAEIDRWVKRTARAQKAADTRKVNEGLREIGRKQQEAHHQETLRQVDEHMAELRQRPPEEK